MSAASFTASEFRGTVNTPSAVVAVGASPVLTAACAQGVDPPVGVSYQWYRNSTLIAGATGKTYTVPASDSVSGASTIYAFTVSNATNSSGAFVAIGVSSTVTPPGACVVNATFDASLNYKRLDSTNLLGTNTNYVVKLEVPATGASTAGRLPVLFSHIEAPSSQRGFRTISVSKNACDYTASAQTYVLATFSGGASYQLTVNDPRIGYPNLTTGTWYINVKNAPSGCPTTGYCNVALEWSNY